MEIKNEWQAFVASGDVLQYLAHKETEKLKIQDDKEEQKEIAHGGNRYERFSST